MTDLYSPDFGTDIKTWPSTNLNSKKEIELKLTLHIQRIEERIKNEQALTPSTDDEEMLESIKIISIDSYQDGTSNRRIWLVKLLITTINGETTVIEKEI